MLKQEMPPEAAAKEIIDPSFIVSCICRTAVTTVTGAIEWYGCDGKGRYTRGENRMREYCFSAGERKAFSTGYALCVFCSEHRKCGATFPAVLRYCKDCILVPASSVLKRKESCYGRTDRTASSGTD